MRIWHFHYYPPISGGGLARYVLDFTQIFNSIEQRIVYSRTTDNFADDAGNLSTIRSLLPLSAFSIEMLQPDDLVLFHVTHTPHASWRSFNAIICSEMARTIVVLHTDLEHSHFNFLQTWPGHIRMKFISRAYRNANQASRVVVFTPHQKCQLAHVAAVDATIAPMPILNDFNHTDAPTEAVDQLLILGERNAIKGYDRFIKFAGLSPELKFVSVGSGELTCKTALGKTVREIETLPYQSSMRCLRDAKALLVFSRTESWGRTILEAFLFEKPVIAYEPVGVLKEVPSEWVACLGTLTKGGSTGLSNNELTSIISKLNSTSTARRIWLLEKNEEYRAIWSRIISDSI